MSTSLRCLRLDPRLMTLILFPASVLLWWSTGGCGFGEPSQTVRLDIAFDRTGTLRSDGNYTPISLNNTITVGDDVNNLAVNGFVSVTLGAVPPGADITRVELRLKGSPAFGNPFGDFVTLSVDHVNVVSGINGTSFIGNTLTFSIATIPTLPFGPRQDVTIDVTEEVLADIAAGRPISTFRLRFSSAPTVDSQTDLVFFNAFPNNPDEQPFAIVSIRP